MTYSAQINAIFEPNKFYNRLMGYNWQQKDWPLFRYDTQEVEDILFAFAEETGHANGLIKAVPENLRMDTIVDMMVSEAIKASEIEGEYLSRSDVASSIRNNLGLNERQEKVQDKKAKGAGELIVAVRNSFAAPLTEETLFS